MNPKTTYFMLMAPGKWDVVCAKTDEEHTKYAYAAKPGSMSILRTGTFTEKHHPTEDDTGMVWSHPKDETIPRDYLKAEALMLANKVAIHYFYKTEDGYEPYGAFSFAEHKRMAEEAPDGSISLVTGGLATIKDCSLKPDAPQEMSWYIIDKNLLPEEIKAFALILNK